MIVQNFQPTQQPNGRKLSNKNDKPNPDQPQDGYTPSNPIAGFYKEHRMLVNIGGGALLGAGIARMAGLPSEAVMSAAGSGAVGGFFAGRKGPIMAAGAVAGAAIASLAGAPGAAVVGAAGTGTVVAWIFG
ncbi:hypothetical protein IV102_08895 [bacterium]|nr:hypothetical protein [bacterium]